MQHTGERWFGHYRLDRLLGSGGTGQVWRAWDTVTDRDVALKLLSAAPTEVRYRQRFTREARLAAQVRGPHLVPIHAFGEIDDHLYLAMEYVDGSNLAALLGRGGPLPAVAAVAIVGQTATALNAAHQAGLVHRDIKPSNIMVSSTGVVYLIDFGSAYRADQPAITADDNVVGTLAYMAPERLDGVTDARSDQYSLACVLYECLTSRRPFGKADSVQQMRAHLLADPPLASAVNPALPAELDEVIARAMAKDPDLRWSSAGEFASAAYAAATGREGVTVDIAAGIVPAIPLPRQPQLGVAPFVALAALAFLVATIGGALWLGKPERPDTGSAAAMVPPATPIPAPPPSPVPPTPDAAVAPAADQRCDPPVDDNAPSGDDAPETGSSANWTPAQSITDKPKHRNGKPGNGSPRHGDGKPAKPGE